MRVARKTGFLISLITFLAGQVTFAQDNKISVGVLAEYVANVKANVIAYVADKYYLEDTNPLDGYKVGAFAKLRSKKRAYWYGELTYLKVSTFVEFVNLRPQEDMDLYGTAELAGMAAYWNRMLRLNLGRGVYVKKWLSVDAGLITSLQFKDPHLAGKPDSYFMPTSPPDLSYTPMREAVFRLADGFNTFLISANVRASYIFGPLTVQVAYEGSLTSVTNGINYRGVHYPVHFGLKMWTVGVGYTLFKK